jgi:hypothetical protein
MSTWPEKLIGGQFQFKVKYSFFRHLDNNIETTEK